MNQLNSLKTNHLYQRISNTVIESPLAIRFSLNRVTTQLLLVAVAISLSGCFSMNVWQWGKNGPPQEQQLFQEAQNQPRLENPLTVPVVNRDILWNQIVDTVDDYFRIRREEPIQLVGNTLTEGYIETIATDAATVLEPWRKDGVAGYERIHATLQSIRRQAEIRVRPVQNGFQIEIIVHKELEDLDHPQFATVGGSTVRHDGSLTRPKPGNKYDRETLGWIPMGRDVTLEQAMLRDLRQRLSDAP